MTCLVATKTGRCLLTLAKFSVKMSENQIDTSVRGFSGKLVFFVNGKKVEDSQVDPEWTLSFYLRKKLRLCGTKQGCEEGGCGACTVMVSKYDRENHKEIHYPVNSCLAPICSMHGLAVTTVEGIGSTRTRLHPVQERIAKAHGTQCGFCTPGMVMSMYTLLRQTPKPKMSAIEEALQGNLCRCTGYRPIIEGFKTFTEEDPQDSRSNNASNGGCALGKQCCKLQKHSDDNSQNQQEDAKLFNPSDFIPYHPSQEPIFPPELKLTNQCDTPSLVFKGPHVTWYRPTTLSQLLHLKATHPHAKIVAGNTIVVFETKFGNQTFPLMVHPKAVPEMVRNYETTEGVRLGASSSLEQIRGFLKVLVDKYPEEQTRLFKAIVDLLHWFGSKQVRSTATLGGNIMTSSPTCDLLPILMASRVKLDVHHIQNGNKFVVLDDNFILGNKKNVLDPSEVLVGVHIPFSTKNQYFQVFKQTRRREVDVSIVNFAVKVILKEQSNDIVSMNFGIGGLPYKAIGAPKTSKKMKSLSWGKHILDIAYPLLLEDLSLKSGAPGGMIPYRQSVVLSMFLKSFLAISLKLENCDVDVDKREISGATRCQSKDYKSSQYFKVVPGTQIKSDSVQRPMVHVSAFKQATGEAMYCDDMPSYEHELFMALVFSSNAHAEISVDLGETLKMAGVHGFLSAEDLTEEENKTGAVIKGDEQIFYSKKVTSEGQVIGAVLAENKLIAHKAAKLVKVSYKPLQPLIVTIEDAIKHNSFFHEQSLTVDHGNVDEVMKKSPHVIKGSCRTGNQKNFYLEPQSVMVVPKGEDEAMDIFSSTQSPTDLVKAAAQLLGIQQNKLKVHVKRVGGAFGGKEWKSIAIALPAIAAARKFQRPIRCVLERDQDTLIIGGRIPYLFNYTVGFDDGGKILGCDFEIYLNCGHSLESNRISLRKTLDNIDNGFCIPSLRAKGSLCKTNIPSNTAMRGFGGPEGQFSMQCIIEEISQYLQKDVAEVSTLNLYREGNVSFYGQKMVNCTMEKCWDECLELSKYCEKRIEVEKFNSENRYKKRGLSIVPNKFGIAPAVFPPVLHQAAALVLVYTDGSVLLHHGGVEMGQGLNTKLIQVASRVLEIPAEKIYIEETATNIVPNSMPTIGSLGSDVYGPAVLDACSTIKNRLCPYKNSNPNGTWEQWIQKAFLDKVSLSATGFYKHISEGWDPKTGTGNLFNYFVYGAGCSEVEVDVLSGDHQVLSTNIVMDIGESLNPAIDIGQIEGAFMQGYGFFVMEDPVYSPGGILYTRGPGMYKIPGIGDIPGEFNVSLLKGSPNPKAVYSSKAIGEPPLFLASSVYFAIKDAIKAARKENGVTTPLHLDPPATSEKIRMACEDSITSLVPEDHTIWRATL